NPRGFAELLGISYSEAPRLSPTELAERLDRVLQAAQQVMRQVPADRLGARTPGGERTLRDLGYHIFRLSLVFRDAAVEDRFPEVWLLEKVPAELRTGEEIARYGTLVRERLEQWFTEHAGEPFLQIVQT